MWQEHYRIGVDQIDDQHKQLLLRMEEWLGVLKDKNADHKAHTKQMMEFVKSYTVVHFETEEMYQQKTGFAGAAQHKKLHEEFKARLHEQELGLIRSDYERGAVSEFASAMTRWWIFHIMQEDQKMRPKKAEK